MSYNIIEILNKYDVEYIENFKISDLSSVGIGGFASILCLPKTNEELIFIIDIAKEYNIKYKIVGKMTNLLFRDTLFDGILIKTTNLNRYSIAENIITAESGISFSKIISISAENNLGGAEELFGIPGSVGGMIYSNAGAYKKEISDLLIDAIIYIPDSRIIKTYTQSEMKFSYRSSVLKNSEMIVLSARFAFVPSSKESVYLHIREFSELRKATQPLGELSLGSVFKKLPSGVSASYLIDKLGLKGTRIGDAQISEKHAGFIINKGNAAFSDYVSLISLIKSVLYDKAGVKIEEEIEII